MDGTLPTGGVGCQPNSKEETMDTKPGFKTSEFIGKWMASLVAGGFGITDPDPRVRAAALLAIGFMFGMYALSRSSVKGKNR